MARPDRPDGGTSTRARGARYEALAERALVARGLRTLTRNFTCRGGEIDLVMLDGDVLVFVEVRYRRSRAFGGGAASIDHGKQRRLWHAAEVFRAGHRHLRNHPCRFDAVIFSGAAEAPAMDWIAGAFSG